MSGGLLRQWLSYPLLDREQIVRRQDYVEALVTSPDTFGELHGKLMKGLPDTDALYKKISMWNSRVKQKDTIKMLVQFYHLVDRVELIVQVLENNDGPYAPMLRAEITEPARADLLVDLKLYKKLVERFVDLDAIKQNVYRLRPDIDERLSLLTRALEKNEDLMKALAQDASHALQLKRGAVKMHNSKTHGRCFRITSKGHTEPSGYAILSASKEGFCFTNAELNRQVELRQDQEAKLEARQVTSVLEVMDAAASFLPSLRIADAIITELDCFLAMAQAALTAPTQYVRPEVLPLGSDAIRLVEARHPCVELTASAKSGGSFIPNDVTMERDTSRMQIMTGPNMGGKSTYIRMTGVICVMAQVGSFVPCTAAQLTMVDQVLARVGAGDDAHEGMSTFMAEMVEAAEIVKNVTDDSLVIIDELGRGTGTSEGFGLAFAIAEHLAKKTRCLSFCATHFAELTSLSEVVPCVTNLHVAAHVTDTSLVMMFQVLSGAADRSYGVHVAQVASFPPAVVSMASDMAKQLEKFGNADIVPAEKSEPQEEEKQQQQSPSPTSQLSAAASSVQSVSSSGGKRVQSDSDLGEREPLSAFEQEILNTPLDSFKNEAGEVDRDKYRAFRAATRAKHGMPAVKRQPKSSSAMEM